ncbi:MAG: IPTL-CTERM sorting domain-containing protein, partial [Candidatus Dadabacteria bacterium]|nr:IPTL-CTERM sorting domain-containing protein [Candidatus Dadabacteria bacterium]
MIPTMGQWGMIFAAIFLVVAMFFNRF